MTAARRTCTGDIYTQKKLEVAENCTRDMVILSIQLGSDLPVVDRRTWWKEKLSALLGDSFAGDGESRWLMTYQKVSEAHFPDDQFSSFSSLQEETRPGHRRGGRKNRIAVKPPPGLQLPERLKIGRWMAFLPPPGLGDVRGAYLPETDNAVTLEQDPNLEWTQVFTVTCPWCWNELVYWDHAWSWAWQGPDEMFPGRPYPPNPNLTQPSRGEVWRDLCPVGSWQLEACAHTGRQMDTIATQTMADIPNTGELISLGLLLEAWRLNGSG